MSALAETMISMPVEGIQNVTPFQASKWLENINYKHQRKIRPYHVNVLANEMSCGRFLDKTSIHFCVVPDGAMSVYALVNGQHTLKAMIKANHTAQLMVIVNYCKTWDEVADHFARHDTHLTRQMSDSLVAHEVDVHFGITRSQLSWLTAGVIYYAYMIGELSGFSVGRISHDEKLKAVLKHGPSFLPCIKLIMEHGGQRKYMSWSRRKTTFAMMRIIFAYDMQVGEHFWGGIMDDDGLKKGDPRKALLKLFENNGISGVGVFRSGNAMLGNCEYTKGISLAWNAYIEGRSLQFISVKKQMSKTINLTNIGKFRA